MFHFAENKLFRVIGKGLPIGLLLMMTVGLYEIYRRYGYTALAMPDSRSYHDWDITDWYYRLASVRTIGYPWLLSVVKGWGGVELLPPFQVALHGMAVVLFYTGLRALGVGLWTAFYPAAPLLFIPIIRMYGHVVLGDAPALSLAIMAMATLFIALGYEKSWAAWGGLAVVTMASWLVRPMYLFLIPLIPTVATGLAFMLSSRRPVNVRGVILKAVVAVLVPFLLYCGMRWVVVDHFGVVSFGGVNIAGIATPLLTPHLISRLPIDMQPLAQAILVKRKEAGLGYPLSYQGFIRYNIFFNEYNYAIHGAAYPAALELHQNNAVLANRDLSRLSMAILWMHPWNYAAWLGRAMVDAVLTLVRVDYVLQIFMLAMLVIWLARLVKSQGSQIKTPQGEDGEWAFAIVAWTGTLFFLAGSLEVVMVELPIERYVMGTGALVDAILGAACYRLLKA